MADEKEIHGSRAVAWLAMLTSHKVNNRFHFIAQNIRYTDNGHELAGPCQVSPCWKAFSHP
jgi:hypothetical protein